MKVKRVNKKKKKRSFLGMQLNTLSDSSDEYEEVKLDKSTEDTSEQLLRFNNMQ